MQILDDIAKLKILVVGDVMLDRYWWGSVGRISPEAPVPIVQLEKTSMAAGGAANVAANLAGLGASPQLIGAIGADSDGRLLTAVLDETEVTGSLLIPLEDRPTTIKTRIVAHSQHVVRIDQETTAPVSDEQADTILAKISELLPGADALIISDYAKGLLSDHLLRRLISEARRLEKLIVVDPKGRDFARYNGATVVTPNMREACDACGLDIASPGVVERAGQQLLNDLDISALLITEGENGMTLFERTGGTHHLASIARDVFDVTGAGDTVIAAFTAAAAAGRGLFDSARLANAAAGLVVGKVGTTTVSREMLTDFLISNGHRELVESFHA